jgi:selenocysteine-specific elongation factor
MADRAANAAEKQGDNGIETPVVVGTAGHVDHGKSALVMRLTGVDPDRLPQEKARGITIDLGFAELALPSGRIVGLVDVPGHGHYVRAMVTGASGVDIALLVIAADDGVMPQTREHLRILELLGVRQMVVALTKIDLVDEDWLGLVKADVEDYLGSTAFSGAPIIPVSSKSGQGIDELAAELDRQVDAFLSSDAARRRQKLPARLPVDRVFTVAGAGTVVTGTTFAGAFNTGDEIEISPGGGRARVRGIQVHNHAVDRAIAGQRTALNLVGAPEGAVVRGCTIAAPGSLRAHDRFDARLKWLGRDGTGEKLESGQRVHVCTNTSQTIGRILLFDGAEELASGQEAFAQIRLDEPLAVLPHDAFVVMSYSPVELVGGGEVLLTDVPRRSSLSDADRRLLACVSVSDDEGAVLEYAASAKVPLSAAEIAAALDVPADFCASVLQKRLSLASDSSEALQQETPQSATDASPADGSVSKEARIVSLPGKPGMPGRVIGSKALDDTIERMVEHLDGLPDQTWGIPALSLRDAVCPRVSDDAFLLLVDAAIARGAIVRYGTALATPKRAQELSERSSGLSEKVGSALSAAGIAAPMADELAEQLGLTPAEIGRALRDLEAKGKVEQIQRGYYLDAQAAEAARKAVREAIESHGGASTASELRDALGISRKYAMPLLEHFDETGLTLRDPDNPNYRKLRSGRS